MSSMIHDPSKDKNAIRSWNSQIILQQLCQLNKQFELGKFLLSVRCPKYAQMECVRLHASKQGNFDHLKISMCNYTLVEIASTMYLAHELSCAQREFGRIHELLTTIHEY